MWIDWWGGRDYLSVKNGENQFKVRNCPVTNCKVIDDKTKVNDTDLVVVHGVDFDIRSPIPKKRPSNQRWIIAYYESPSYKSLNNDSFKDVFNLTATYHIDSDFPGLYSSTSQIKWELNEDFDENYDYTTDKIDMAAAVISNKAAHVTSNRLLLIAELRKYMNIDIYGYEGNPCFNQFRDKTKNSSNIITQDVDNCKEIIFHEYKFYFAFENSLCDDYITEKFFLTLVKPIVPVVFGAGPYDYYVCINDLDIFFL